MNSSSPYDPSPRSVRRALAAASGRRGANTGVGFGISRLLLMGTVVLAVIAVCATVGALAHSGAGMKTSQQAGPRQDVALSRSSSAAASANPQRRVAATGGTRAPAGSNLQPPLGQAAPIGAAPTGGGGVPVVRQKAGAPAGGGGVPVARNKAAAPAKHSSSRTSRSRQQAQSAPRQGTTSVRRYVVRNGTLTFGARLSLRVTTAGLTSHYIRHYGGQAITSRITSGSSSTSKADSTWIVHQGFANSSCVSFESRNYPGQYLRHLGYGVVRQHISSSAIARADATFCVERGKTGHGYSFRSYNYPARYLRHYGGKLYIASNGGSQRFDTRKYWPDDVSFMVTNPWS